MFWKQNKWLKLLKDNATLFPLEHEPAELWRRTVFKFRCLCVFEGEVWTLVPNCFWGKTSTAKIMISLTHSNRMFRNGCDRPLNVCCGGGCPFHWATHSQWHDADICSTMTSWSPPPSLSSHIENVGWSSLELFLKTPEVLLSCGVACGFTDSNLGEKAELRESGKKKVNLCHV